MIKKADYFSAFTRITVKELPGIACLILVPLTGKVVFFGATLVGSSRVFSSFGLPEVNTIAAADDASFFAPLRVISVSVGVAAALTTLTMISPRALSVTA